MAIAITEEHKELARAASDFLSRSNARQAARSLLEAEEETLPPFWAELVELGWLGIHLPEEHGGAGYGLPELVVVVEELGRVPAPGPFTPTVITSALIAAAGSSTQRDRYLRRLAEGSLFGGLALHADVQLDGTTATGQAVVLGAGFADVTVLAAGDDVLIVDPKASGASVTMPPNLDTTRRSGRLALKGAEVEVIPGCARVLVDLARTILSAEAVGVATECTEMASAYAKQRVQFGRPIAMFQAVKHHCANMAVDAEMAASATWDAARAAESGGDQLSFAAAVAATKSGAAADLCANLSTQVHGGIAITWAHDAHLFMRRGTALLSYLAPDDAASDLTDLVRRGVRRSKSIELPPEAEHYREEIQAFIRSLDGISPQEKQAKAIEAGYMMSHWPKPYGRDAGAVQQLIIREELEKAGIERPDYAMSGWNVLTIIQHGTQDQRDRFVHPTLKRETIWCQLFSEPDAGSDAAGIKTRGTRVEGGWLVNGQKVWTSSAHLADLGLATVRTNPDLPKHQGITTMVIDMHGTGVDVRPLKQTNGNSSFNEVFLTDVFVPDDDVVGPADSGWTVARATLGNESVSIGEGRERGLDWDGLVRLHDEHPERLTGGPSRLGRHFADGAILSLLNLRAAHRAVAAVGPGPEGAMTKLVQSESRSRGVAMMTELLGDDVLFSDGLGAAQASEVLIHRAGTIAGGSSEIKRNQIGERILGLPRDPLIG